MVLCYSREELIEIGKREKLVIVSSPRDERVYEELKPIFDIVYRGQDILDIEKLQTMAETMTEYDDFFPIGHYYSPYSNLKDIEMRKEDIFSKKRVILDVDLRIEEQLKTWKKMSIMFGELPGWRAVEDINNTEFRYRYHNPMFSLDDAVVWHCILRMIQPNRVIEVGSGWSTAVALDTNEFYLDNMFQLKCIEPYPKRLYSIMKNKDEICVMETGLQEIPVTVFDELRKDDILFIDSTHVSKVGSDVNYLLFEILPRLNHGVYIHFHDIFYPFEYSEKWLKKGIAWNEAYMLRAFLQNNKDYEIIYFQNMIEEKFGEQIIGDWPFEEPWEGGSLYLKKL